MKPVRFEIEDNDGMRYEALYDKGETHKSIYLKGLAAAEIEQKQISLGLEQPENGKAL